MTSSSHAADGYPIIAPSYPAWSLNCDKTSNPTTRVQNVIDLSISTVGLATRILGDVLRLRCGLGIATFPRAIVRVVTGNSGCERSRKHLPGEQ